MLEGKRMAVALGGLGAIVLLGLGASFAVGGEQSQTDQVRAALHGGQGRRTSSSSSATAWASPRSPPPATTSTARTAA